MVLIGLKFILERKFISRNMMFEGFEQFGTLRSFYDFLSFFDQNFELLQTSFCIYFIVIFQSNLKASLSDLFPVQNFCKYIHRVTCP
jgi:hypothetical protein